MRRGWRDGCPGKGMLQGWGLLPEERTQGSHAGVVGCCTTILCHPPQHVWKWIISVRNSHCTFLSLQGSHCPCTPQTEWYFLSRLLVARVLFTSPTQQFMQLRPVRTLQTDKLLWAHAVPWMTWVKSSQQTCILVFGSVEQSFQDWTANSSCSNFYPATEVLYC